MAGDWSGRCLVALTWSLIVFANFVTVSRVFNPWFISPHKSPDSWFKYTPMGTAMFVLYQALNALTALCHIRAVFGDPGTTQRLVSQNAPVGVSCPRICKPCGYIWKPPRAHHCRKCELCVYRMDHHCAWIANCVGIMNQKFFILFLIYAAILCGFQLFLLIICIVFWIADYSLMISLGPTFLGACVTLESAYFVYMTTEFLREQVDALETNSTLVESHQHAHGPRKKFWTIVTEVFGDRSIFWLLPTLPDLKLHLSEPVYLDKEVAIQLRHNRKRIFDSSLRQPQLELACRSSPSGGLSSPSCNNRTIEMIGRSGEIKLRNFPFRSSSFADTNLKNRAGHSRSGPIVQDPLVRPQGSSHWPEIRSSLAALQSVTGGYAHLAGASCEHIASEEDESDSDEDYIQYEEQRFKNVYMIPWQDIGVELDDESKFVHLEDLEGNSFDEDDEDEVSDFSGSASEEKPEYDKDVPQ